MIRVRSSLTFRIIALSGIWIFLALLVTGLLLVDHYRNHIAGHFDAHVFTHLEELVAAGKLNRDGEFEMTSHPSDPRFYNPGSGWYWEVRYAGDTLERSESLGERRLDLQSIGLTERLPVHEIPGPHGLELRVQTLEAKQPEGREPLLFVASSPTMRIQDDVRDFSRNILIGFVVLLAGLLLAVLLQVRIALKPLKAIGTGIGEVREGRSQRLAGRFPDEVQPLVDELNNLLEHNAVLLKRARNQLGDLAHSVKNPLAVINNEARNLNENQRRLILKQTSAIAGNVENYLSRARVFGSENVLGSRSRVSDVLKDLVFAMKRIYQQRELDFDSSQIGSCWFRGEQQDLEEMLGNLIDNACKWAEKRVVLSCTTESQRLRVLIEDDGPGIDEDRVERALSRGQKLDESVPGHGLGLSIVRDMAHLYGGTLTLGKSRLGGVRAGLELPGGE
jgi:signal transduction histidine kinase